MKGTKSGQTWTWTTQGEYWYDANGAMAKSVQAGVTTEYVYRGHDPLCERTGTGVFTDYIYVNGHMAAKQTGSDTYYYIRDALGSTRLVYSGTSQVFSVATYTPFGTPVGVSGTDQKWKYAGEMLVGAAGPSPGLYYIGARWMDPELGRFISLDPQLGSLSSPQTLNRYVYCVNNPLRFVDPTGQDFFSWLKGVFFSEDYRYEPFDQEYHPGEPLGSWNPPWENKGWQLSMAVVGIACGAGVGLTYLAPVLPELPLIGRWLSTRLGPSAGRVSTPIANNADDIVYRMGAAEGRLGMTYTSYNGVMRLDIESPVLRIPTATQTTLESWGLEFSQSGQIGNEWARNTLSTSVDWRLVGSALGGAAAERVGEALFEGLGSWFSGQSSSMPEFG